MEIDFKLLCTLVLAGLVFALLFWLMTKETYLPVIPKKFIGFVSDSDPEI